MIKGIAIVIILSTALACNRAGSEISLAGNWALCLDSTGASAEKDVSLLDFNMSVFLPSTLDSAGIGKPVRIDPVLNRETMLHLQRKVTYIGPAYYQRDVVIPNSWNGRNINLKLERVIWESTVWIDGKKAGNKNSLSTPHYYDLSAYLTPGKHKLTICIDNSRKFVLNRSDMAHAYTAETQIKWNGILGEISLESVSPAHISGVEVFPDFRGKSLSGEVKSLLTGEDPFQIQVDISDENNRIIGSTTTGVTGDNTRFKLNISGEILPWNDFSPVLYNITVSLIDNKKHVSSVRTVQFGFRDLEAKNKKLYVNGEQIFLRGTLECCIFPLTGHPPMGRGEWEKIFATAREYGLNHLRFHSWCPPEAAFAAADKMGMYLQVELPNWSLDFGSDMALVNFIYAEADKIITEYGNHPSFCFLSMGNELEGNFDILTGLVSSLKNRDGRHLYTTTTYTFQKGHGLFPEPVDDFYITQNTEKGWVRGQGVFDQVYPNFNTDYTESINHLGIPVNSHEIGQYSVFPDMREIAEYKGVLSPVNFIAVKNELEKKGLLGMAESYTQATGKFATILYKEEIERALKTEGLSGLQLLDLHDFPGQGTALVGILNAFWKSKGFVSPEEWRMFCSEVVPLLWYEKATFFNDETFTAEFGLANFYKDFKNITLCWKVTGENGATVREDSIGGVNLLKGSVAKSGKILFPLDGVKAPAKYTIEVSVPGTKYKNQWNFWVYPKIIVKPDADILVTSSFKEAIDALKHGKKVLLNPDIQDISGIEGKFVPVFWSPVHFPNQPGTMGLLINPLHAAFRDFPTDFYSNWQWWDLCKNSKTLQLDSIAVEPIVRVIDNFFKNRRLGNVFEAKLGDGRLLFSSIDLHTNLETRPVAKQLKYSLMNYMSGSVFNPTSFIKEDKILSLQIPQLK